MLQGRTQHLFETPQNSTKHESQSTRTKSIYKNDSSVVRKSSMKLSSRRALGDISNHQTPKSSARKTLGDISNCPTLYSHDNNHSQITKPTSKPKQITFSSHTKQEKKTIQQQYQNQQLNHEKKLLHHLPNPIKQKQKQLFRDEDQGDDIEFPCGGHLNFEDYYKKGMEEEIYSETPDILDFQTVPDPLDRTFYASPLKKQHTPTTTTTVTTAFPFHSDIELPYGGGLIDEDEIYRQELENEIRSTTNGSLEDMDIQESEDILVNRNINPEFLPCLKDNSFLYIQDNSSDIDHQVDHVPSPDDLELDTLQDKKYFDQDLETFHLNISVLI